MLIASQLKSFIGDQGYPGPVGSQGQFKAHCTNVFHAHIESLGFYFKTAVFESNEWAPTAFECFRFNCMTQQKPGRVTKDLHS